VSELLDHIQQILGDRYLIEREHGRGGMAYVFLARDRRYEWQVAIKVLDPDIATAVGAERFLREIRITAQLQHPHIVPLLDSGEASNLLYAVMPFVEGESLRDFGIARAVGLAGGATLTGVGFPIGTAAYMSPEQATAASPVDGRSDIYSLGCVLYEMIAGRMAFTGPSLKSVLTQQLTVDPPLVHISRPDVPPAIIAIVRRCMMKQPEDRYQSAGELAEDLRGTLAELPRLSTPVPREPAALPEGDGATASSPPSAAGSSLPPFSPSSSSPSCSPIAAAAGRRRRPRPPAPTTPRWRFSRSTTSGGPRPTSTSARGSPTRSSASWPRSRASR
jgi:serine/threonine-protein kinase